MPPQWLNHTDHVQALVRAALEAADPAQAVRRNLSLRGQTLQVGDHSIPLAPGARVYLVGAGKAGAAMTAAAAAILGERLTAGVMAIPEWAQMGEGGPVEFVRAGHPRPNEGSLLAGHKIRALLNGAGEGDCVLALISGGGSALLELPGEGLTLEDLQAANDALLNSGASIVEVNTVRRRLSQIKGGGLARMAGRARVAALILSDVVGDPLDVIASGPTAPDTTSPAQAIEILSRYGLMNVLPARAVAHLRRQAEAYRPPVETAAPPAVIVGSNTLAVEAAAGRARDLDFEVQVLTTFLEGEAREVGKVAAALAKEISRNRRPLAPPAALIAGGETTVTVRGGGCGGRNQELALSAAIALDGWERALVASFATDGLDGPTQAAGAVATGETLSRARGLGLSAPAALAENDSHRFFVALGDLVVTGPTGTNVNDIVVVLVY